MALQRAQRGGQHKADKAAQGRGHQQPRIRGKLRGGCQRLRNGPAAHIRRQHKARGQRRVKRQRAAALPGHARQGRNGHAVYTCHGKAQRAHGGKPVAKSRGHAQLAAQGLIHRAQRCEQQKNRYGRVHFFTGAQASASQAFSSGVRKASSSALTMAW